MATTRKSTSKQNSNSIYNYPIFKDGDFGLMENVPFKSQPDYPNKMDIITYKNKVLCIFWANDFRTLIYIPRNGASGEYAVNRFSPKTVISVINSRKIYPQFHFAKCLPEIIDVIPESIFERLIPRDLAQSRIMRSNHAFIHKYGDDWNNYSKNYKKINLRLKK